MSVKSHSSGGSGDASANATASSMTSLTSFSIKRTSSSVSQQACSARSRQSEMGSRSFSGSTSYLVR